MAMTMIRPDAATDMLALQNEVNRIFGSFFEGGILPGQARRWMPAMDLVEDGDTYLLRVDLPGIEQKDIDISVQDGMLTVSGERSQSTSSEQDGVKRLERSFGRFERSVQLPRGVEAAQIHATCDKGVLEVSIPKPQQPAVSRVEIAPAPAAGK